MIKTSTTKISTTKIRRLLARSRVHARRSRSRQ